MVRLRESSDGTSVPLPLPGLEVTDWIPNLVWYCADGATIMQGRQEGVYALLRDLQREICGWSVVVPIHANCHRRDIQSATGNNSNHPKYIRK